MEQKTWKFDIGGKAHVVRLDWTYWGGRRRVFVDDLQRDDDAVLMRWRSTQNFEINDRPCAVTTEPSGFLSGRFCITLDVDGERIAPEPGTSFWESSIKDSR